MSKVIRIGTRDSELALWQAKTVQNALEKTGHKTQLVPVKSTGDLNLDQPLYEMGITGIFTKTLDVAMIKGEVDIAVHSMKDVPTALPKGIVEGAVMKRASNKDILVHKGVKFLENGEGTIATGSLRRKAQWLNKYPGHNVVDLRGNVNTRMQKLNDNDWNGAIFAAAGLERIEIKPENFIDLNWMIPAPAQGAMLIVAMENDDYCREALAMLNHKESEICVHIEREFLKVLEGGCTAPIGALAKVLDNHVHFHGALFSLDGTKKIEVEKSVEIRDIENLGKEAAMEILTNGGKELMDSIKSVLNN
ncbi:hydroxymethylbilane synthase [Christiangramia echinicola]|uniref:Hydroxymethylbilane synthase n=1 Tax=Christiangramia echinicola TaxID=279359 RepID=A0A1H1N6C3_9FLAO|nr:hydroxymethylbilane synthase [Christiangramia echinicola]SDR94420.1 hydroxymethylbilane synthase [Christiangramia echinicola]